MGCGSRRAAERREQVQDAERAWFCHWDDVPKRLNALHGPPAEPPVVTDLEDADVVGALLSLHELSERRHQERKQQAAAEQAPVPPGDPGWEF